MTVLKDPMDAYLKTRGGGGRLQFFLPGCVSMGLENRPILKGLNDDNLDSY